VPNKDSKLWARLEGLDEQLRAEVFTKLKAAGFAQPGMEEGVDMLDDAALHRMHIEPLALRYKLLKMFEGERGRCSSASVSAEWPIQNTRRVTVLSRLVHQLHMCVGGCASVLCTCVRAHDTICFASCTWTCCTHV
jgi:hypothetical protein